MTRACFNPRTHESARTTTSVSSEPSPCRGGTVGAAPTLVCLTLLVGCTGSTESGTDAPENLRLEALTDTLLAGTVGTAVTPVPVVRVTRRDGRGAPGIQIAWVLSGGGYMTSPAESTDQDGRATLASWVLGGTAGPQQIRVLATGLPDVVFKVQAQPGPVARIEAFSGAFQVGR